MVIFTIVFGRVAGLPSEGTVPYPVMVFAGMLPWFLFSTILSEASATPRSRTARDRPRDRASNAARPGQARE
jgi:ABC-type polysaccharide/polyol phosphate export permease